MSRSSWLPLLFAIVLSVVPVGASAASSTEAASPPTRQPRIAAVSSQAGCLVDRCTDTVTLTYNVPVMLYGNVAPDFSIDDLTTRVACSPVLLVPPPTASAGTLTLNLYTICFVTPGDRMQVTYRQTASGYVASAASRPVMARTPQRFNWTQGPTICCTSRQ